MNAIDCLGFHQQALVSNPKTPSSKAITRMQRILGQVVPPISNHPSQISASVCQSPNQKDSFPSGCFSPEKCLILTKQVEHIEFIHGNCDISQSRVVFFSDIHDDQKQHFYQIQVLKELLQPGDVLLYEGSSDNPPCTSTIFPQNVTIQSWEDQKLYESDVVAARRTKEIFEILKSEKDPIILAKLDKEFWELHGMVMAGIERRNEAMIMNIRVHLESSQGRIFVLAGSKHLNEKLLNRFKGMQTTLFFKDQRKESALVSHDSRIQLEQSQTQDQAINIRFPDGSISHFGTGWFNSEQGFKIGPGQKVKFKKEHLSVLSTLNEPNAKTILENPEAEYEIVSEYPNKILT